MKIAYVRVSAVDQNEERQIEALKNYNIEKWFSEKVSAKDANRPELQACLEFAREGDTIYVHDFSRLARSTKDLLSIVDRLRAQKVELTSLKESFDTSTPTGQLILTVIAAINQFERANMLERQREGIALAKAAGKYKGKRALILPEFDFYYERYLRRQIKSKTALAKELKISRPTVDKLIKQSENQRKIGTNVNYKENQPEQPEKEYTQDLGFDRADGNDYYVNENNVNCNWFQKEMNNDRKQNDSQNASEPVASAEETK